MITDYFAEGEGAFLWKNLVKKSQLFSYIDAWVVGAKDPGLMVLEGKLSEGVLFERAVSEVRETLQKSLESITDKEVFKLKNKIRTNLIQSRTNVLSKVISLAFFEMLGDIDLINREGRIYDDIEKSDMLLCADRYIDFNKCNILYYEADERIGR